MPLVTARALPTRVSRSGSRGRMFLMRALAQRLAQAAADAARASGGSGATNAEEAWEAQPPEAPHPAAVPMADGVDGLSALPDDVKVRRAARRMPAPGPNNSRAQARLLVQALPADAVARMACVSREWRRACAASGAQAGVWAQKHATLLALCPLAPPAPPPGAPPARALAALAAALDGARVVAARSMDITHFSPQGQYWCAAPADLAAGALVGAGRAALCRSVCWFDVRATLRLPPGTWLLRWRLRALSHLHEPFALTVSAEPAADGGAAEGAADNAAAAHRVIVTPVPRRLGELRAPQRAAGAAGCRVAWCVPPAAAAAATSTPPADAPPQRFLGVRWRPKDAPQRNTWLHLPVAVVHVAPGCEATVTAAMFKHTNNWCNAIVLDCLQAVPLAAAHATLAPLPRRPPRDAFADVADGDAGAGEYFGALPLALVPPERWAAPHWATLPA